MNARLPQGIFKQTCMIVLRALQLITYKGLQVAFCSFIQSTFWVYCSHHEEISNIDSIKAKNAFQGYRYCCSALLYFVN